jgi:hypothetical protein
MDWILDNLQIILAVAGAIAYWLNARKKEKAGEPADYDGDGKPDVNTGTGRPMREPANTFDEDYETRRIQEEIRRKIAERNGGTGQPASPPPLAPPPLAPTRRAGPAQHWDETQERRRAQAAEALERAQARRRAQAEARRAEAEEESALALERQRTLAAQLAALQARKIEATREANAAWTKPAELGGAVSPAAVAGAAGRREDASLLSELRNARSLRRAIVLREVLGTPVGLR